MGQLIVQHYRGLKEHYNVASHGQGIYFATDTKEIILKGETYGGGSAEALENLMTQVRENSEALLVINGTGDGSVDKKVNDAINEFAGRISDDGTVNTFKELVDYAAEHGAEFGALVVEVDAVKQKDTEQDSRIEALEVLVGGSGEEGSPSLVETVTQQSESIEQLNNETQANTEAVASLQTLVGDTPVSEQISEALSWEDVE